MIFYNRAVAMPARYASYPTRLLRLTRLAFHVAHGLWILRMRFGTLTPARQEKELRRWARRLLTILDVRPHAHACAGQPPSRCMVIANHVSWLDIFVLQARWGGVFVAKAEIRTWPVLGRLVAGAGTLFIERGNRSHARRTNERIAAAIAAGRIVTVFPQGRTAPADRIEHFHAALLQPAIDAGAQLMPVGLRYVSQDGTPTAAADYLEGTSFMRSLWRIASQRAVRAELHCAPRIDAQHAERRRLADEAQAAIARALDLAPRDRHTGTRADPPAAPQSAAPPKRSRYPG
jgi:1-acyl-sn-glycerol-3-phosphate acyltransferase